MTQSRAPEHRSPSHIILINKYNILLILNLYLESRHTEHSAQALGMTG